MIRFACPGCEAAFTVGDEKAGKTGKCPKCSTSFVIPDSPAPEAFAPPAAAPPAPAEADVEIAPCPGCRMRLSVAPGDLGGQVECPGCKTTYTAERPGAGRRPGGSSLSAALGGGGSKKSAPLITSDDDAPRKKRKWDTDDRSGDIADEDPDDYDRPTRRSRRRQERGRSRTVTVTRVGVLSAGKVMGGLSFVIFGVICAFVGLLVLVVAMVGAGAGGPLDRIGVGLLGVFCYLLFIPVFYGVIGFIIGVIYGLAYNAGAGIFGGLEMDIDG